MIFSYESLTWFNIFSSTIIALCTPLIIQGQISQEKKLPPPPPPLSEQTICHFFGSTPIFPGCKYVEAEIAEECSRDSLLRFIQNNLIYPDIALNEGIKGTVIVQVTVQRDGVLTDFKILRSLIKDCDEEALRIAALLADRGPWIPSKTLVKNIPVPFLYRFPVKFTFN